MINDGETHWVTGGGFELGSDTVNVVPGVDGVLWLVRERESESRKKKDTKKWKNYVFVCTNTFHQIYFCLNIHTLFFDIFPICQCLSQQKTTNKYINIYTVIGSYIKPSNLIVFIGVENSD